MPANSRDTQGPQNKDKASLTPHRGANRQVWQRGPKPGSQEKARQENEVSARAGEDSMPSGGPGVKLEGLTLFLGILTCMSCGWLARGRGVGSHGPLGRAVETQGVFPETAETSNLKRESLCKSCSKAAGRRAGGPALLKLVSRSASAGYCLLANVTLLLLPTRLIFHFPP
jgi:hypothetical protein